MYDTLVTPAGLTGDVDLNSFVQSCWYHLAPYLTLTYLENLLFLPICSDYV